MFVLGLTGSIGMGKTVAAAMFRRLGAPVYDADQAVHALFASGGAAVAKVEAAFPGVTAKGAVDRKALGALVFGDRAALKRLESVVHPLVREAQREFLRRVARRRAALAVLDVPLLFETGGDKLCDAAAVVSAPAFLQRRRVLARPGMTEARLNAVLAEQMPDFEKRRRADYVILSGLGRGFAFRQVSAILADARSRRGTHWPPF